MGVICHTLIAARWRAKEKDRLSKINGHMTQLKSANTKSVPSNSGLHSSIDSLDTFSLTEFIDRSHDKPSALSWAYSAPWWNSPSKCQVELSNLGPIVPEFPPPPSEDIAYPLQERFKGKHHKYLEEAPIYFSNIYFLSLVWPSFDLLWVTFQGQTFLERSRAPRSLMSTSGKGPWRS